MSESLSNRHPRPHPSKPKMPCNPVLLFVLATFLCVHSLAQDPEAPPRGQVIASSESQAIVPPDVRPGVPVTDAERSSIEVLSLNLDIRLIPAESREAAHVTLTLRNRSEAPIPRIPLQLSSTLHWFSASAATATGLQPIPFNQSPIATDADHTGYAQEAIFTPAEPLAPGATLTLSVFYAGQITRNADRLELIGAPHDTAAQTDWDAILPTTNVSATALRGFGNVLWYPVAASTALFGSGNQFSDLISRERLRNTNVSMHLRLTVEYVGDPPDAAIFDGQLQPLVKVPDADNQLVDDTHGTAIADFPLASIGFRLPSLFLTAAHAVTTPDELLTIVSTQSGVLEPYAAAVASLQPLLSSLLGPTPRAPLLLLDHPGEPFQDAGFLAARLNTAAGPRTVAPQLVRALAHAWLSPPSRPVPATSLWIEEGMPEYISLLWTERMQGREAATDELRNAAVLVALAEPDTASLSTGGRGPGQPLIEAHSDVFLRLKSAFVFRQLRQLLGDELFSRSLTAWRRSLALNPAFDRDERAFEKSFERTSGRDLSWFFDDWVYRDGGLPDLTIVQANSHPLPARGGRSADYLVAVEVRNDGEVVADVPVTVRSGQLFATERLRIAAHASASTRVVFEGTPEIVEVNDGSVPELRATGHTYNLQPSAQ